MRRARCLLALSVLLAGCASLAPDYERPEAPVAGSFAGAGAADLEPGGQAAADVHWREFFHDERLRRLIEIALDDNRDLRTAMLGIERARALYGVSRADLYPAIGIGANRTRQPGPGGATADLYSVGFALSSWEIDFFGRIRSLNAAALSRYLASGEARNALQTSLVAAVATSYLNLLAGDELIAVTRQALQTREESARLTRLMYDNGVVSELDLHQAQSLLESARASLAQLTRQRAIDENALVALLGRPLPAELPPGLSLQRDGHVLAAVPAGLPSEVLIRRPDVREAELQLIASNANIGAARAAFFPRIALTATAGTASDELSGLFEGGSGAWTFAAQLLQPLFDAGRNRANLRISRVDREIAVARYEQVIQNGFREVSDALAGRATFGEQLRAEQALANAEQARLRLSELRYRSGTASYLEVLDAQRSLLAAQQAVARTRAAQLQNQVALYRALGGGWHDD
ncbi:MAG TPA: efflux transporter outer membrane subunit, partial [Burkholderiaceae bacterium]|nr:efflux transporter outer membrane subunit [Burkholderiaceae bacterium]